MVLVVVVVVVEEEAEEEDLPSRRAEDLVGLRTGSLPDDRACLVRVVEAVVEAVVDAVAPFRADNLFSLSPSMSRSRCLSF